MNVCPDFCDVMIRRNRIVVYGGIGKVSISKVGLSLFPFLPPWQPDHWPFVFSLLEKCSLIWLLDDRLGTRIALSLDVVFQ